MRTPDPFPPTPLVPAAATPAGDRERLGLGAAAAAPHHRLHEVDRSADDAERAPAALLTPEDVAALLQIDRETVYRMARRGELPAIKLARHWRFREDRLRRWLADLETGPVQGRT